jgi:hypothetical protein
MKESQKMKQKGGVKKQGIDGHRRKELNDGILKNGRLEKREEKKKSPNAPADGDSVGDAVGDSEGAKYGAWGI